MSYPHLFGVRHLSPAGAYHLRKFLDQIQPTAVLVEGLADGTEQIEQITAKGTKPPIAILAYTEEMPIYTLLYPFAAYCPEYQAFLWAKEHKIEARFIDLPSENFIKLEYLNEKLDLVERERETTVKDTDEAEVKEEVTEDGLRSSVFERWAKLAGADNHEAYWERFFEHNLNPETYLQAAKEFGKSIRLLSQDSQHEQALNLVREAYMRRQIAEVIASGHQPERIVVVTGAYHTSALREDLPPMSDQELAKLPRVKTKLTLMPYSYYRLSTKSGYGAGNHAPAYYELMWQCMQRGDLARLPVLYLAKLAGYLRKRETMRSTAEVIEGVRLANTLAAMHDGAAPTLDELRDAAQVCLGRGEYSVIAEAVADTEIGTAIGALPKGVSRTSIQDNFYYHLKDLKLEKYQTTVASNLELDLRENRRVKSEAAAFLDLRRSCFLHQLKVLGISFQRYVPTKQETASWAEAWVLRWTPEAEIELVESVLKGETIQIAVAYTFKERLENLAEIKMASLVIREACECGMPEVMEFATQALRRFYADSGSFEELAGAACDLSMVISFGSLRRIDATSLVPPLQELFVKAALLLIEASNCDEQAARGILESLSRLNEVALKQHTLIDEELWLKKLRELAQRDDRNPRLSGAACAILVERGLIDAQTLAEEVSRRLSPGVPADLGAGWFEGLAMRNRYALLSRLSLWEQLDQYLNTLDEVQFKRALVFLRRALGEFTPDEKRRICENLGEIWGEHQDDVSDLLSRKLTKDEEEKLQSLNEFDFDDL